MISKDKNQYCLIENVKRSVKSLQCSNSGYLNINHLNTKIHHSKNKNLKRNNISQIGTKDFVSKYQNILYNNEIKHDLTSNK